ncbi:MAG: PEP/pyruvate-binding domain-containing protein [Gemmatimonadales bacterium]|nr:PEP/pyruvate-binding domain-containing protein [Gemmatimonadales bacterium]
MKNLSDGEIPVFSREFLGSESSITRIGSGAFGGKASGLIQVNRKVLSELAASEFPEFEVNVPTFTVLATDVFDEFMAQNDLYGIALSDESNDRISHAFQQAVLPALFTGDLRSLISEVRTPLAIRSSSLLEDDLDHPFAGVYGTKMIPNLQADIETRFRKFQQAIKYVYASMFFRSAKEYIRTTGREITEEKMAVIVQEMVGLKHDDRFYPHVSGVARSYNYYPSGHGKPEEGVVNLALGLGKQIVDGGLSWNYTPTYPQAPPPYNNIGDQLKNSQTEFWCVHMGTPPIPDPAKETEYMVRHGLKESEYDGTLTHLASVYDPRSDRLRPGIFGEGPRALDFAPILQMDAWPLNDLVKRLLALAEAAVGCPVEVEFAVNLDLPEGKPGRFGFLQMRPMMISEEEVTVSPEEMAAPTSIVASMNVMGNGVRDDIRDVVFLKPEEFEAKHTSAMAREIESINNALVKEGLPYLLIGFGRWGSSDPWLGVPVEWAQIGGARVIVEATLPQMNPDLSQGSHFFHNLISFQVQYLSVKHTAEHDIAWEWLDGLPNLQETKFVKHVRLEEPLTIKVDGRHGRGVIQRSE